MSFDFRPAVRENVNLLLGLAGGTGSGKTFTGMRLASGMTPPGERFAVIDTENGRASHYADRFAFDVAELHAPFTPERYTEAILAADKAGYAVIMVDSMSHEYAGEGGVLDMQEAEFQRMGGRDSAKVASWIKPKGEHKKMVSRLLQVKANLILCFRAEPKIEIAKEKDERDGKMRTVIVPKKSLVGLDGWIPVTEKNLPFELTVSLLFTADAPGIPKPIKLQEQHRPLFPLDKAVSEASGKAIYEWAKGGTKPTPKETAPRQDPVSPATTGAAPPSAEDPASGAATFITADQVAHIDGLLTDAKIARERFLKVAQIAALSEMLVGDYAAAVEWIQKKAAK